MSSVAINNWVLTAVVADAEFADQWPRRGHHGILDILVEHGFGQFVESAQFLSAIFR